MNASLQSPQSLTVQGGLFAGGQKLVSHLHRNSVMTGMKIAQRGPGACVPATDCRAKGDTSHSVKFSDYY